MLDQRCRGMKLRMVRGKDRVDVFGILLAESGGDRLYRLTHLEGTPVWQPVTLPHPNNFALCLTRSAGVKTFPAERAWIVAFGWKPFQGTSKKTWYSEVLKGELQESSTIDGLGLPLDSPFRKCNLSGLAATPEDPTGKRLVGFVAAPHLFQSGILTCDKGVLKPLASGLPIADCDTRNGVWLPPAKTNHADTAAQRNVLLGTNWRYGFRFSSYRDDPFTALFFDSDTKPIGIGLVRNQDIIGGEWDVVPLAQAVTSWKTVSPGPK